jgi:hypothetical protein
MYKLAVKQEDERGEVRDEVLLRTRATDARGRPIVMTVVNLSPGGLMARTDAALATGDRATVELPTLGRVRIEVRWVLGGRIGCRFEATVPVSHYYPLLAAVRAR